MIIRGEVRNWIVSAEGGQKGRRIGFSVVHLSLNEFGLACEEGVFFLR